MWVAVSALQRVASRSYSSRMTTPFWSVVSTSSGGGSLTSPVTTFTYDAEGQVLTVTDPLSRTTTFTWNSRGWTATQTDAAGSITTFSYDDAGNPTWYISAFPTPNPRVFDGSWWSFANGQSMGGPPRPATL